MLGDGVSAFLSVIRSLGRQGLQVHVAWCQPDSPALRSRYVNKFQDLPFCDAEGAWVGQLQQLLEREHYDLVMPTNEQSTRAIYLHRQQLEPHARLYLMDEPAFDVVFDKVKSGELAERLGLRVPKTRMVTQPSDVESLQSELAFPLVLKPISSYDPHSPLERRNVVKAYHHDELDQQTRRLLPAGPFMVQENFIGRGVGVELLVYQGIILLAFQHERVHQPIRGGASSYRKSVPIAPDLLDASKKFVAAMNYSGVIMVEFLVNDAGTDWRFVEANGRFWGSLPLAVAAGADFPFALYQLWVHDQRKFEQSYRVGLYCRNPVSDALWFLQNLRADRSDPTLATLPLTTVLAEVGHVLTGRERFDTFTFDDPLPAIAEPLRYLRRGAGRLGLRARARWASLPPVRARQRAHTQALAKRAKHVVFLCWGNICRSPFAGYYAQRVWPADLEITSRGLHYQQARLSPPDAVTAAREHGIDLDAHRSALITAEEVKQADMIVCFDELVRRELLARHPEARNKAVRFGTLSPSGPVSVSDPFSRGLAAFRDAYQQIKQTLDDTGSLFAGSSTSDPSQHREPLHVAP